jgi:hypothetical protein
MPQIPVHPLLANAGQAGQQAATPIQFAGYVGKASQPGMVRLYSTLTDLSHYLEFDEKAVVQSADAAESVLPNNGVLIWVDAGTPIRWVREYQSAKSLAASIANNLRQGGGQGGSQGGAVSGY